MKKTIAIQLSYIPERELLEDKYALEELGIQPIYYGLIPFSTEITEVDEFNKYDAVFPFGTVKLIKLHNLGLLPKSARVFYDEYKFDQHFYSGSIGSHLFNFPAKYAKLGEVKDQYMPTKVFIKPTKDLKAFAGLIIPAEKTPGEEIYGRMHDSELSDDEEVMIVEYRGDEIVREYRNFVVNGELIDGCTYKIGHKVTYEPLTPTEREEIVAYWQNTKRAYQPGLNYVVDYVKLTDGRLQIMEFNCIHCAGMYCIDRKKLFKAAMEVL